jgi:hypothetical protein
LLKPISQVFAAAKGFFFSFSQAFIAGMNTHILGSKFALK